MAEKPILITTFKIPNSKILIYGSIAYDILFSIAQDFRDAISVKNNQIPNFNATYVAHEKTEFRGGTAGNIGYWLGTQDTSATIFSSVGRDFNEKGYQKILEGFNHKIAGPTGSFTAHCYQASDPKHQQLVIWQPNSYELIENTDLTKYLTQTELAQYEIAIFAPGTPESTTKHLKEFRQFNRTATVLLDPSQNASRWNSNDFLECLNLSQILIGNETEFSFYNKMMSGKTPEHLHFIKTFGEKGTVWQQNDEIQAFPAVPVKNVVETTGAGDAFRAGLICGLIKGKSFADAIKLGNKLGAKAVECQGAQE